MNYVDAIAYLKEHNITKDDGTFYELGEVRASVNCLNHLYSHSHIVKSLTVIPDL